MMCMHCVGPGSHGLFPGDSDAHAQQRRVGPPAQRLREAAAADPEGHASPCRCSKQSTLRLFTTLVMLAFLSAVTCMTVATAEHAC